MNDRVEAALRRLAQAPVPPALADIERRVLDSIAREADRPRNGLMRELRLAAAVGALLMGIVAGSMQSSDTSSSFSLSPLDGASVLAPSSVLLRHS